MKKSYRKAIHILLSLLAVLALQCNYAIGGCAFDNAFLNILNRLVVAYGTPDITDIIAMTGVFLLLKMIGEKDEKPDIATGAVSFVLAALFVAMLSIRNYGNFEFLFANGFQCMLSLLCICGIAVIVYCVLRAGCLFSVTELPAGNKTVPFLHENIGQLGFWLIFVVWMAWILMNYPGTACPDMERQLSEYLGDVPWSTWHPPLSSFLIGLCYSVGKLIRNPNFGLFLYCFIQTLTGALVFSYGMKKLQKMGVPDGICIGGILFFALVPLWGVHAQWLDKDFLYAEITVLQAICMMEILRNRECNGRQVTVMTGVGILACLLRNNGIYAIVPALVALCFWLKGASRRRMLVGLLGTMLIYLGVQKLLYPAMGIEKGSIGEMFSIPIQQTARYVCTYSDEVTEYEKEILSQNFHYEALFEYRPEISDPVKNHFTAGNLPKYLLVWWQMFLKHPGCYFEAFFAKSYGYLAPVEVHIEGWIGSSYSDYLQELGVYHPFSNQLAEIPRQIMFLGEKLPILRYFCMPGTYTWMLLFLTWFLVKRRRAFGLILFIPSYINILVCTASPLHNALRYELPVVAVMPLLIGWVYYCLMIFEPSYRRENQNVVQYYGEKPEEASPKELPEKRQIGGNDE